MSSDSRDILKRALQLPAQERGDLAARLIQSLDDDSPISSEQFDQELLAEAERRLADIDSGRARTLTWPEIRRKVMGQADEASAA